jgi:hypothetical protein
MTMKEMIKETMPWILLVLLFAGVVRLSGIAPGKQPQGGATSEHDVSLHAAPGAMVTGDALFSYDSATGQTTITLTVMHLPAGSVLRSELRSGTCASVGTVLQTFPRVRVDRVGAARVVAHRADSYMSRRWVVTIQAEPGTSSSSPGRVRACAAFTS